ncbi:Puff-specific protein Bx42 [Diplonema papillatum]|nr:Puff-specific protein Bx42 [Diplonema papillatum]WGM49991.1 SKIP [Diplonema papillatum]
MAHKKALNIDFGDGGAFPEIHRSQFPLDMGRPDRKSNALAVVTDSKGVIQNTAVARVGGDVSRTVYSKYSDLLPKDYTEEDLQRPTDEELDDSLAKAQQMLMAKVNAKTNANRPGHVEKQDTEAKIFRYTPSDTATGAPAVKNRMIKMVEMQRDPLEPPRFRVRNAPGGPPSPPAPVLHSPPKKLTLQDMQDTKVPPSISDYKNPKGYIIPMDKRMAADGRSLMSFEISDRFASFSQALDIAEKQSREEVEKRIQVSRKVALKQKEKKEGEIRKAAMKAREEKDRLVADTADTDRTWEEKQEERKRNEIRDERRRKWEHEQRIAEKRASGRGGRGGDAREGGERDVSEKIALGLAQPTRSNDSFLDQRLFNQDSGQTAPLEDDDSAFVKPLLGGSEKKRSQFRPSRDALDEEHRRQTGRGEPVKSLQFETSRDADPFDMDAILDDVKTAADRRQKKRPRSPSNSGSSRSDSRERARRSRR